MAEKSIEERKLRAQKATSLEELEILAKDDGSYVRYFVAKNENTPVPVLEKLSWTLVFQHNDIWEVSLDDLVVKAKPPRSNAVPNTI